MAQNTWHHPAVRIPQHIVNRNFKDPASMHQWERDVDEELRKADVTKRLNEARDPLRHHDSALCSKAWILSREWSGQDGVSTTRFATQL